MNMVTWDEGGVAGVGLSGIGRKAGGDHIVVKYDLLISHGYNREKRKLEMLWYRGEFEDGDVIVDVGLSVVGTPDDALHPDSLGGDGLHVAAEVVLAEADHEVGGTLDAVHGSNGVPLGHHNRVCYIKEAF